MGSGANTPANVSPTSPRTAGNFPAPAHHAPLIRPLKTPIYVPAALRRTEKPGRQSPPKIDSANHTPSGSFSIASSFSQALADATPVSPISRIATEDWNSIYETTPLSPVAGPISKNHWQVRCIFLVISLPSPLLLPISNAMFSLACLFARVLLLRTIFAAAPLALQRTHHPLRMAMLPWAGGAGFQ